MTRQYAGARAVPLINREDILDEIRQVIEDPSRAAHVFYITGLGGYGKTHLLREVLQRLREGGRWASLGALAATSEVDLYHTQTHSLEGLARAIRSVLPPVAEEYFKTYQTQHERLEALKPDRAVALRDLAKQRDDLGQTFLNGFNAFTRGHRVVWALDTAEKLLYESDRIQEMLRLGEAGVGVRPWLIEQLLPGLENTVVLIAGRPKHPRLGEDLSRVLGERLHEHQLEPFDEEDSLAYFEAVIQAARDEGDVETAERVSAIPEETRRVIHLYAGGRPILLALVIDYYAATDQLVPELKVSLDEARRQTATPEGLKRVQSKLEADVVRLIQETGRLADEAIRSLAYARKGMNAELLARVAGLEEAEAREHLRDLQAPPGLSFVKIRPRDNRVFLHDEMYDLLERHVLDHLPEPQVEQVYSNIIEFYAEKVHQARDRLEDLESRWRAEAPREHGKLGSAHPTAPTEIEALTEARQELQDAIVEAVHYRLREAPLDGFQAYYEYAEEAFQANDEGLEMQLRDELLAFLAEPKWEGQPEIHGLSRSQVEWDAGVRWIRRYIGRGKYDEALEIARRLREECADLMAESGLLAEAELNVWGGWAVAYRGRDLALGERSLRAATQALPLIRPEDEFQVWRRDVLLARAYNNLGYLYRVHGRYRQAVAEYRRALPLWRALGPALEVEHANTLNNLAWALAEEGEFLQALRQARDGLKLRQELGPRAPVGLSLNTLGLIQTRADQPHAARLACERALAIFHELEQPRGVGLSCRALAEALRRMSSSTPEIYFPEEQASLLRDAEGYGQTAVDIFAYQLPGELSRRVEALIELGCVYRDWAWLRPRYASTEDPGQAELADRGIAALRQAVEEAHGVLSHLEVDALVNLAWLYHYTGQPDEARRIIHEEVRGVILQDYYVTPEAGPPRPALPISFFWVQLGKANLLLGQMEFDDYLAADKQFRETREQQYREKAYEHLRAATREYTLALAYNELYSEDFRDLRRGQDRIYENFKTLNPDELRIIPVEVHRTAEEYHLGDHPLMLDFLAESFGPLEGLAGGTM